MSARLLVLVFSVVAFVRAQAPAADGRLNLSRLVEEALERNPDVAAAQKRYEAMAQRPRAASALPDPMLSLGYNSSGYPLPGFGLGREPVANIGLMYSQEFPYPGKRSLRVKIASKEAQAEWDSYLSVQLATAAKLKLAYYRLQHTYSMLDVLGRNAQILKRMLEVAESRYSVGKGMQQDIFRIQTQLSILETRKVQFERELRSAESALNTVLNRPWQNPLARPPEATAHEDLPPIESILGYARENAPSLGRSRR